MTSCSVISHNTGILTSFYELKINLRKDEAAAALISDANKFLEKQEMAGKRDQGMSIPLLMQNKVPEGFEEEEGALKVDVRPESSKLEDYDEVPVGEFYHLWRNRYAISVKMTSSTFISEQFGIAMLRGMGFKEEEGIGKTKQKIDQIKIEVRPKGLGLGAIPVKKKIEAVKADAKDQVLTVSKSWILISWNLCI